MNLLSRWNPFKSTSNLTPFTDFDDVFRNLATRSMFRDLEGVPDMRLDVSETESAYAIKADIPGVTKEDISVSIDGNLVSISAEARRESETKDETQLCSERYVGRVSRSFSLPVDVDQAKAEARYDQGVLTLNLPKKPNGQSKKIKVS